MPRNDTTECDPVDLGDETLDQDVEQTFYTAIENSIELDETPLESPAISNHVRLSSAARHSWTTGTASVISLDQSVATRQDMRAHLDASSYDKPLRPAQTPGARFEVARTELARRTEMIKLVKDLQGRMQATSKGLAAQRRPDSTATANSVSVEPRQATRISSKATVTTTTKDPQDHVGQVGSKPPAIAVIASGPISRPYTRSSAGLAHVSHWLDNQAKVLAESPPSENKISKEHEQALQVAARPASQVQDARDRQQRHLALEKKITGKSTGRVEVQGIVKRNRVEYLGRDHLASRPGVLVQRPGRSPLAASKRVNRPNGLSSRPKDSGSLAKVSSLLSPSGVDSTPTSRNPMALDNDPIGVSRLPLIKVSDRLAMGTFDGSSARPTSFASPSPSTPHLRPVRPVHRSKTTRTPVQSPTTVAKGFKADKSPLPTLRRQANVNPGANIRPLRS